MKTGKFRRKFVKISETEAHSFFENWQVRQSWESLIWKVIGVDCQFFLENENYPMLRNIVAYPKIRLLKERIDYLIFDGT